MTNLVQVFIAHFDRWQMGPGLQVWHTLLGVVHPKPIPTSIKAML